MHPAVLKAMNSKAFENVLLFWRLMWFSDFDRKWKHSERLSQASESARFFLEAKDGLDQVGNSPTHAFAKTECVLRLFCSCFFPPDGVTRDRLLVACQRLYNIVAKCNPKPQFWRQHINHLLIRFLYFLHVGSNLCHRARPINKFHPNVLWVTKFGMFSLQILIKVSTARKAGANMQLILFKNLYLKPKLLTPSGQLKIIMLWVCLWFFFIYI